VPVPVRNRMFIPQLSSCSFLLCWLENWWGK